MNGSNTGNTGDIDFNGRYVPSDLVVAREIEGEFLLVPIASGIGDMDDALYTLNETGREVWNRLGGDKTVSELVDDLLEDFEAPRDIVCRDVDAILSELLSLKMVERLD